MKEINLRDLFPEYKLDCFIEVPDEDVEVYAASITKEAASVYFEFARTEAAYQRRRFWHRAHYSLNAGDGIEANALSMACDPYEEYERKETMEQLYTAINSLPDKQAKRIYSHYILGMAKSEIARVEGVDEKAVRVAISRGILKLENILRN